MSHISQSLTAAAISIALTLAIASPALALTQDALYYYKQGFAAEKSGQKTLAYDNYKKALAIDPTDSTTYLMMGHLLLGSGQANEASDVYQAGLAHNPNDVLLNAAMGRLLERNQMFKEAGQYSQVLAESHFDFPYVFSTNAQGPNQPVTLTHLNGQSAVVNANPGYSRSGYESFMERPQFAELYEYMGNVYARTGRLKDAYNAYTMAVKVDPQGNPQVYSKLAAIAKAQGDEASVIRAQNNALAYQKLQPAVLSIASVGPQQDAIKSVSARVTDAPTVFSALSSSAPSTVTQTTLKNAPSPSYYQPNTLFFNNAAALTTVPSESLPFVRLQKLESFQKYNVYEYNALAEWIIAHPDDIQARLAMASMDVDRSREDQAMVNLNEILWREPNNVGALWLRGKALTAHGRYDDAIANMEAAYSLQPENTILRTDLISLLRKFGRFSRADEVLASAGLTRAALNAPTEHYYSSLLGSSQLSPTAVKSVSASVAYPLLVPSDLAAQSQAMNAMSQQRLNQGQLALPAGVALPQYRPQVSPQSASVYLYATPTRVPSSRSYYVMP